MVTPKRIIWLNITRTEINTTETIRAKIYPENKGTQFIPRTIRQNLEFVYI